MKKQNPSSESAAKLRQKAEEKRKARTSQADTTLSEAEKLKLIHELEVHQIELELQNEELVAAKEKAEQAEEKYTNLYDFAPSGYLSLTKEADIIILNFAAARMLGKERSKLINSRFSLFLADTTRSVFHRFLERAFTDKEKQTCEVRIEAQENANSEGHPISICVTIEGIVNQHGDVCHLTVVDITERKKAEEEIEKLSKFPEENPNPILRISKGGAMLYHNNASELLLEHWQYQEKQQLPTWLFNLALESITDRAIKNVDIEMADTVFSMTLAPVVEKDFVNVYGLEITKRKQMEKVLSQSNATKDKFLSIISHDLRSPFASILSLVEVLGQKDALGEAEFNLVVEHLKATAKNSLLLLDNLLSWSKAESGLVSFKPEKQMLAPLVKEVFELFEYTAQKKKITLNYLDSEEITVFADQYMLQTIVRNLTSNALKFSLPHGKVEIHTAQKDKHLKIAVSDSGVGIDAETQQKLFEFKTNESTLGTADEKGTGLGLMLCKDFVEKHGGEIWVESEKGKGTTFYFTLPAALN